MKKLDIKTITDAKYEAITDYDLLGGWKVEDSHGIEFDFDFSDLQEDEKGNILKPTSFNYNQSSYCDEGIGYNTVDDSDFQWLDYEVMITKEELDAIIKGYIHDDAVFMTGLLAQDKPIAKGFTADFIKNVMDFTK